MMQTMQRVGHAEMPVIGLGTLRNKGDDARRLVGAALAVGYRHLDTAEYYGNEEDVGAAVRRSSVPRDQIWLTTKILHPKAPPESDARTAAEHSMRRLGVDYIDALLMHWPNPAVRLDQALSGLAAMRDAGNARVIGVSNFPTRLLKEALDVVADLAINQVEYHPYLDQQVVLSVVRENGMVLTAHSPLALGRVLDDPVLAEIAAGRGLTVAQVALRWLVQQENVAAIPGGSPEHVDHLRQNLAVLDVSLTDEEMRRIGQLARGMRVVNPPHAPEWDDTPGSTPTSAG